MKRITRFIATASLLTLLAACGGEGGREREIEQVDWEKPSLGASKDDDDSETKKEEKESREDEDRDDSD